MEINSQEINIDDLYSQKYMHKEVKKGIFLSEYQLDILRLNGINIDEISSINELIFEIENVLDEDNNEQLEQVCLELSEFNYYHNTNK